MAQDVHTYMRSWAFSFPLRMYRIEIQDSEQGSATLRAHQGGSLCRSIAMSSTVAHHLLAMATHRLSRWRQPVSQPLSFMFAHHPLLILLSLAD